MLISPEIYLEQSIEKSYDDLIKVRDKLIREIRKFEKGGDNFSLIHIDPSPEVFYQMNLLYLAKICELISIKYRDSLWEIDE